MNIKTLKSQFIPLVRLTLINLLISAFALELLSLAYYALTQKAFFYTQQKSPNLPAETDPENTDQQITRVRLHPYLGYVKKQIDAPELGFKFNNYGFAFPDNYPYQRLHKKQFLVGIFGGSVAAGLANYETKHRVISRRLQQIPQLANQEIVILPFARSGYKQPQMLIMLNYFMSIGQEFDLVINIDGFNDVAIAAENNQAKVDISMPNIQAMQPLINLASNNLTVEAMQLTLAANQAKNKLAQARQNQANCWLAVCDVAYRIYYQYLENNYRQDQVKIANLQKSQLNNDESFIQIDRLSQSLSDRLLYEKIANLWSQSSILMSSVLTSQNIPYFHFLQPNQYYSTSRKFSELETKITILPNYAYGISVKNGYPYLLKKLAILQKNQVPIFNAVTVFDQVSDIVYLDNCCHYNDRGHQVFAEYIADVITSSTQKLVK